MSTFTDALLSWQGLEHLDHEIERRKLFVPRFYQTEMTKYCQSHCMDHDLPIYWSECSKERIFSAGQVDSNRRLKLDDAPYRSAYLDELMARRKLETLSNIPELHPCLRHWIEAKKASRERKGIELWEKIEEFKSRERERQFIPRNNWDGSKVSAKSILCHYASMCRFEEKPISSPNFYHHGKVWIKTNKSGLIFLFWLDMGGLPECGSRLPVQFFVSHEDSRSPPFGVGLNTISAGADYYAVFKNIENGAYGIYALVEIFDAFASSFD